MKLSFFKHIASTLNCFKRQLVCYIKIGIVLLLGLHSTFESKAQINICSSGTLSIYADNYTVAPYKIEYVLVCGGTVYGPNSTGIFDLEALGISGSTTCTAYAVNHDGYENFSSWPTPSSLCLTFVDTTVNITDGPNLLVNSNLIESCPTTSANLNDAVLDADGGSLTFYSDVTLTTVVSNPTSVSAGTYYIVSTSGTCQDVETVEVIISPCLPAIDICDNEILSVSASNDYNSLTYQLEYVLVCGGTVYGPNITGNFDLDALGISGPNSCTVYAVNHDGSETFATWPTPVSSCLTYIERTVNIVAGIDLQVLNSIYNDCPNAATADLNDAVINADGGTLSFYSNAALTATVPNPTSVAAGTYYIVSSNGSCQDDEMVTVGINYCVPDTTVCESSVLSVGVSYADLSGTNELSYVLVCGGVVLSTNSSGNFDFAAIGVSGPSTCTIYAVNHDGNANFSSWPPTGSTCIEYIERDVIISDVSSSSITDTICSNTVYTLPSGTNVFGPGTYVETIPGSVCDSVITITLVSPPSAVYHGLYAALGSDYLRLNPLTGAVQNTYNANPNSLGWINGAFTIHEQNAVMYWISEVKQLNSLNLTNGNQTAINTAIGSMAYFWGLKYYNGYLYTITTSADNDKMLVRINPSTGNLDASFTGIEINGTANSNILSHSSLIINPNSEIFYIPLQGNILLAFNVNSGVGNIVNLSGYVNASVEIGLLEINEYTGEMYALSGLTDVVSITPTTATAATVSLVKTLTSVSGYSNSVSTFDSDNNLYIFQAASGCTAQNPLLSIDVSTGQEWCSDPTGIAFTQLEYLNCTPSSQLRNIALPISNTFSNSEIDSHIK